MCGRSRKKQKLNAPLPEISALALKRSRLQGIKRSRIHLAVLPPDAPLSEISALALKSSRLQGIKRSSRSHLAVFALYTHISEIAALW
jgi:hypothetical protein